MSPRVNTFHSVNFTVSNALQASFWYCTHFGFERFAERKSSTFQFNEIAVRNGKVILVFKASIQPVLNGFTTELAIHGDFVKDLAFAVDDVETFVETIEKSGGKVVSPVSTLSDAFGSIKIAVIATGVGSLVHSLIQNVDYTGVFLPGFVPAENYPLPKELGPIHINELDHVVENYAANQGDVIVDWYKQSTNMTRFWSIDDLQVYSKNSALKAQIVANSDNSVQVVLVEPVATTAATRGQVQEFLDFHGGAGCQHIAFAVDDIISVVGQMKARGVEFLPIPDAYYDQLELRLADSNIQVKESLTDIRNTRLLVDFDEHGYLLQCFSKPVEDRPTLFIEVIKRYNFNGFGAGNFKALFEAVEEEQRRRGTLFRTSNSQTNNQAA